MAACLLGNGDLFKEIRKIRKSSPTVANVIDGVYDEIPSYFAGIYSNLYNSCNDSKSDPIFEFNSDCLKNARQILFEHMATLFKTYLVHGHASSILTMSTLVPILKDKLGNICAADNYRSIAISSLGLKSFDWVIILIYGGGLNLDELQFSYQPNCSTNMCTWMAVETIDYFVRNESELFTCAMDMSKSFDKVKHRLLFKQLQIKGLPVSCIRLLLIMYKKQVANVRWNS